MRIGKWSNLPTRQKVRVIGLAGMVLVYFPSRVLGSVIEGHSFVGDTVLGVVSSVCMVALTLSLAASLLRGE